MVATIHLLLLLVAKLTNHTCASVLLNIGLCDHLLGPLSRKYRSQLILISRQIRVLLDQLGETSLTKICIVIVDRQVWTLILLLLLLLLGYLLLLGDNRLGRTRALSFSRR